MHEIEIKASQLNRSIDVSTYNTEDENHPLARRSRSMADKYVRKKDDNSK